MWRIATRTASRAISNASSAGRLAASGSAITARFADAAAAAGACASASAPAASAAAARCLHSHTRILSDNHAAATAAPAASSSAHTAAAVGAASPSPLSSLGLTSPFLLERVRRLGIALPTEIQATAIPDLVKGSSVLLGAETGSGKTLTYLLPALDWLLERPIPESSRKYPRVVVLQPNRELCAQLEGVIASLIGSSGQRDLPVTHPAANGESSTRLHFASLVGTQLFPPPGMAVCDILVCTPSCLQHNLPPVELARLRARAIKQARATAELAAISAGTHAAPGAGGVSSDPSAPVLLTPTSSPGFNPRGFDPLAFVAAHRIIVLDEVDFLLEGGDAHRVRQLLESTWVKFEPPPGLERASTQGRRNRWRREGREDPRERRGGAFDAEAEAEEAEAEASLAAQRAPPPHGRARQFVFVGATLANISPLTTVQYLLNTFTPRWSQPPLSQSGPVSLLPSDLANKGCHLKLHLSTGLHRLSPGLGRAGTVQWEHVGPARGGPAPGEWDPASIDLDRLAAVDRAAARALGDEDDGSGAPRGAKELEEEDARFVAAEALSLRAKGAQKVLKKSAGKKGKNSFGALRPSATDGSVATTTGANAPPPARFEEETDLEKVAATVRFLNAHTPAPPSMQPGAMPRKSLVFVEKNARLATLESHLRSLQTRTGAGSGGEGEDKEPRLSGHVQVIPYHAGLKAEERALAMALFNSRASGGAHVPGAAAGAGPAVAGEPAAKKGAVAVTHQVLLCTSLAARGLDFNQIAPPAPVRGDASASSHKSNRGVAVATAAEQIPGFESLVQFDLATNVVDYIHRCGRMFRHRPAVPAPVPSHLAAAAAQAQEGDASAAALAAAHGESATTEPAVLAATPSGESAPELAKVLNLYTAQDELLVSHLRDVKGGAVATTGESAEAEAEVGGTDGADPVSTLISDAAFSRKRRLRNKARKAERAAAEAAEAESEGEAAQQ